MILAHFWIISIYGKNMINLENAKKTQLMILMNQNNDTPLHEAGAFESNAVAPPLSSHISG